MKYYEVRFRIEAPAAIRQDVCDVLAAMAGEAAFETFELTDEGMTGYVQQDCFDEETLRQTIAMLPFDQDDVHVDYTVEEAPYRDWNEEWEQQGFEPISVGTHLIIYDGRHLPSLSDTATPPRLIQINARQAFGTGTHATTRMMCAALSEMALQGRTLLDCGTGTGILSIVALTLGADSAVGYDIDEWSVDNARLNAQLNGVEERFTSMLGDSTVISQLSQQFDVVAANINRNILLADLPRMRQALKAEGGTLLMSGFYHDDVPLLTAKASQLGLHLEEEKTEDGWSCLRFSI